MTVRGQRTHRMRWHVAAFALLACAGCATTVADAGRQDTRRDAVQPADAARAAATRLPARAAQGAMVLGYTDPAAHVEYAGRTLRVTPYGTFVFGIGRDASGEALVRTRLPAGSWNEHRIAIVPRDWPIERVDGVPPATVEPPPAIAARIEREQAQVSAARTLDDPGTGFAQVFAWPVQGRVSGRFGNQRVYNGSPKAPHSGMDIAAATGTPVRAPASGLVTFAAPDLYLTGGTVLLDHGHGISSNFLHLSRIDVRAGERIAQGRVIGAVGATGRATGPHLHWGMNWFGTRIDPLLVIERGK